MLEKLKTYGVRGIPSKWLQSYLDKRKQFVRFNNIDSSLQEIKCGVPQGSILGPLLFIIYINDICNVSKIMNMILFADDTNLFLSNENLDELCTDLNNELAKIDRWFKVNKLSLNVSKTNYMVFTNRRKNVKCPLKINGTEIEKVTISKFLGVYIVEKLSWKAHLEKVC